MATPPSQTGQEMSDREARSFLTANDTGVLSLGVENRGYGFPISYTYDGDSDRIVLGFVSPPESKKQEFATATDEATFTVYTYDDVDSWKSVIVTGPIHALGEEDDSLDVPDLFFQRDTEDGENRLTNLDEFDRAWYELQFDTLSGRHGGE